MGGRRGMNVWTALVTHHDMKLCHARGSMSRVSVMFSVSFVRKQLKWYPLPTQAKVKMFSVHRSVHFSPSFGWGRVAEVSDCLQFSGPRQVLMSRVQGPCWAQHTFTWFTEDFLREKGILQVIILFWCLLLLLKWCSDSQTLLPFLQLKHF